MVLFNLESIPGQSCRDKPVCLSKYCGTTQRSSPTGKNKIRPPLYLPLIKGETDCLIIVTLIKVMDESHKSRFRRPLIFSTLCTNFSLKNILRVSNPIFFIKIFVFYPYSIKIIFRIILNSLRIVIKICFFTRRYISPPIIL